MDFTGKGCSGTFVLFIYSPLKKLISLKVSLIKLNPPPSFIQKNCRNSIKIQIENFKSTVYTVLDKVLSLKLSH